MNRRARLLLLAAPLALSGCRRFLFEGRIRSGYHGEYAPWLPHVSFIGLFVLAAQIWACVDCWRSKKRGTQAKVLWTLFIFLAPCVGFFTYFIFGYEG